MPEIVVAHYGRYEVVQVNSGVEIREDLAKRRRASRIVAALLLGAAAVLYSRFAHPLAIPFAGIGAFALLAGARARGKALAIGESEVRYAASGAVHDREGAWPRSRVARVRIEKHGAAPRPAERGRRFGPVYSVRIVASDGALHPARFAFRSDTLARSLARDLADRLDVPLEEK